MYIHPKLQVSMLHAFRTILKFVGDAQLHPTCYYSLNNFINLRSELSCHT